MICGNCKARTDDKREVKACFEYGPAVHRAPGTFIPDRPIQSVSEPEPEETYAERYARRTKSPDLAFPTAMAWKIDPGYFAARVDDTQPYEFFRITKPEKGKYAGILKIQTIHGDTLKLFLIIRKDGSHWAVEHQRGRFEEALTMAIVDPRYSAAKFAEIKQRCCNCGKGLTDDRSLWYGIGPECEQFRPDIMARVIDDKGEYAGPQGISA